jgi:hypothetical protein
LRDGEPVQLGGKRQRALLAVLLVHANELVTVEQLIDGLSGEQRSDELNQVAAIGIDRVARQAPLQLEIGKEAARAGAPVMQMSAAGNPAARRFPPVGSQRAIHQPQEASDDSPAQLPDRARTHRRPAAERRLSHDAPVRSDRLRSAVADLRLNAEDPVTARRELHNVREEVKLSSVPSPAAPFAVADMLAVGGRPHVQRRARNLPFCRQLRYPKMPDFAGSFT